MTIPPESGSDQGVPNGQVPPQQAPPQGPPASQVPPAGSYQQQPQQPTYPQQPQQPGYPQQQPGYPQPGYQQPPPPGYQQPPHGYQQPGPQQPGQPADPASTITLNFWLSVFFAWIPALIFWVMEKDKGDQRATEFHTANLNFSLIRTAVGIVIAIFAWIPFVGWVIAPLLGIGSLVLFVFHLMAAISAGDNYRNGTKPNFLFNFPIIK